MTIGTALRQHLINNAGVSAIVNARVFPLKLPQGVTFPAITYQKVSGPHEETLDGSAGYATPRFQIDSWSQPPPKGTGGYPQAADLADRVRIALQGFRGFMGGSGGVQVGGVSAIGERELDEPESGLYRVMSEFAIQHQEATS